MAWTKKREREKKVHGIPQRPSIGFIYRFDRERLVRMCNSSCISSTTLSLYSSIAIYVYTNIYNSGHWPFIYVHSARE